MPRSRTNSDLAYADRVNFAENKLGDRGVRALAQFLYDHHISVRVMYLHQNNLGRAGAE